MANMSYCRFENTCSDFADCVCAIKEEGLTDLSKTERYKAKNLYELALEYIDAYEYAEENADEFNDDDE